MHVIWSSHLYISRIFAWRFLLCSLYDVKSKVPICHSRACIYDKYSNINHLRAGECWFAHGTVRFVKSRLFVSHISAGINFHKPRGGSPLGSCQVRQGASNWRMRNGFRLRFLNSHGSQKAERLTCAALFPSFSLILSLAIAASRRYTRNRRDDIGVTASAAPDMPADYYQTLMREAADDVARAQTESTSNACLN